MIQEHFDTTNVQNKRWFRFERFKPLGELAKKHSLD
jgi:hypothetical protein